MSVSCPLKKTARPALDSGGRVCYNGNGLAFANYFFYIEVSNN